MRRRFRAARATLAAVAVSIGVLTGCRAIIGIDELDVVGDGGPDGGVGPKLDAALDAAGDAAVIDSAIPPAPIDAGCQNTTGMACGMCCRSSGALMPAFAQLDRVLVDNQCICGTSGKCVTDCAASACTGGNSVMQCGACIDGVIRQPMTTQCMAAATACMNDVACRDSLGCFGSCK